MKILGIDTTSRVCNVILIEDGKVIAKEKSSEAKTHSEKLMTQIDQVLKKSNVKLDELDLLGVVIGPGSFTGIRIGIATIKAFADSLNIKVIPVTSLQVLISHINNLNNDLDSKQELGFDENLVLNIKISEIDARNDQIYIGLKIEDNDIIYFAGSYNDFNNRFINLLKKDYVDRSINLIVNTQGENKILKKEDINNIEENIFLDNINIEFQKEEVTSEALAKTFVKAIKNKENIIEGKEVMPFYLKKSQAERMQELKEVDE